jgi:hypothetical protein
MDPAKTREIIDDLRKKLEALPGYVKADSLLEQIMPNSIPIESKLPEKPPAKERTWGRTKVTGQ